ncbi:MAG: citrate (Si)-synthase, eukaryotic [Flavobacteriales bacterium]|nr:MAG: citrate (Si)-synthase, eukaryotic [Flavobacteriales bacterium]
MEKLKEKFAEKALPVAVEMKQFLKEHGDKVVSEVSVAQVFGGMKGVPSMITETSKLDPDEGIRFRGYSIPELREKLPKALGGFEPLPEGIFYLMLIGDLPSENDVLDLTADWGRRAIVPKHVFNVLDALPPHSHPMTQFSIGIMALRTESIFREEYHKGMHKQDYWSATYEDAMNLIARVPRIAAYIYRRMYRADDHIEPDPKLDWAANLAHMLGFDSDEFKRLMRLYMTIHSDHEGGNVSAHTNHLVGSALSDPYLSFSAAMNGLAGPLHGLANQEVIRWIFAMQEELGTPRPTKDQINEYVNKTISEGKVIPGYGHPVLRKTDPRYSAQKEFAERYIQNDELIDTVHNIYEVVPPILKSLGKVKNPWPNVDAHSGALLINYGLTEYDFYTVLFGVSRALGCMAQLVWDRALGSPIERPGSTTLEILKKKVGAD